MIMTSLRKIGVFVGVILMATSSNAEMKYSGGDAEEIEFLTQFGYLDKDDFENNSKFQCYDKQGMIQCASPSYLYVILSPEKKRKALREYQEFFGLNPTGIIDDATKQHMKLPRCGNKDKVKRNAYQPNTIEFNRSKRFALLESKWNRSTLTYKISNYPPGISRRQVDLELEKALKLWQDVTPLKFIHKSIGHVDIEISFESGEHGDSDPFKRNKNVYAHAFEPIDGGNVHFNIDTNWTVNSSDGINLFQVATHEFGHSLGLNHTRIKRAVMYATYNNYDRLYEDDIEGIQKIYGPNPGNTDRMDRLSYPFYSDPTKADRFDTIDRKYPRGTRVGSIYDEPTFDYGKIDKCSIKKVDAVCNAYNGDTYIFQGDSYWRFTETSIAYGYPKKIRDNWRELPSDIDAAITLPDGEQYFFKDDQYWKYRNNRLDDDKIYPQFISDEFPGVPNDLDAVMSYPSGTLFFFKGFQVWRRDDPRERFYPVMMSSKWRGLPSHIDAAVARPNGYLYFFKNNNYYRYHHKSNFIDRDFPPYPRPVNYWWFGCRSA